MKLIWFHCGKDSASRSQRNNIYLHTRTRRRIAFGLPNAFQGLDRCSRNVSIFLYVCSIQRENKEQSNSLEGLSIFLAVMQQNLHCLQRGVSSLAAFLVLILADPQIPAATVGKNVFIQWEREINQGKLTILDLKAHQGFKEINQYEASLVFSAIPPFPNTLIVSNVI